MSKHLATDVALYTSAWIEIPSECVAPITFEVALYTSAWIEIMLIHIKVF